MILQNIVDAAVLVAAGFLAAAQPNPPRHSHAGAQDEALRLIAKGQLTEARKLVADLIENANQTELTPDSQAELWRLLALAENRLGRYDKAEAALKRGVQLCGPSEQPELMIALLVDLADVHLHQGALDEANRLLSRARSIASKHLHVGHPQTAFIQHSLGVLFWVRGELSKAEQAFRLALTIHENSLGGDHIDIAVAASSLAGLLARTGRQPEAIPLLERSKTIFERHLGSGHPYTIGATFALGTALTTSAPAKAELMLREAIANWRVSQPESHPHMIKFLGALASSRFAQGDYREAEILSGQALQMSKEIFGPEHPHAIAEMYNHAQLLKDSRRGKEAAALKKEADRIRTVRGYVESGRHQVDILALR